MANMITEECFGCGACERMCPGEGISQGEKAFVIDPTRCSECVGFYHTQQCARACPVDCCVIDPNNPEAEAELFERAKQLYPEPDSLELGPETSHFQAANRRTLASSLKRVGRRLNPALWSSAP